MRLTAEFILALFAAVGLAQGTALAQTPQPSPGGQAQVQQFAYRTTLSGPSTAGSGERVTYTLGYEQVLPDTTGLAFVFGWTPGAATYVSSSTIAGPSASAVSEAAGSDIRLGYNGPGSGSTDIVLDISPTFVGDLKVGFFVPGTDIVMPEGSVQDFVTHVTAGPPSRQVLPNTGQGSAGGGSPVPPEIVLCLASAALLSGTAALRTRRGGRR